MEVLVVLARLLLAGVFLVSGIAGVFASFFLNLGKETPAD